MNYLLKLKTSKTIIMITHQKCLNAFADKIVVLKKSGECEVKTHLEILEKENGYLGLYDSPI